MTIGHLARRAEVATSTVRYYERIRLLTPPRRTESNYRLYTGDTVERLRFIRAAQVAGLTLADIRTLLAYRDGETAPCAEIQTLLESRLSQVEDNLRELRHVRRELRSFLDVCRHNSSTESCQVLSSLEQPAKTIPDK
ncbi:MAG: heavy metal-responsive transcriptional regulator [Acidobacteria bacterium]|nr:MAG: heavy metal-responsive transcriptional regulator [Acidobacteriota bacterium]